MANISVCYGCQRLFENILMGCKMHVPAGVSDISASMLEINIQKRIQIRPRVKLLHENTTS
jgi:hypothetical protein